MIGAAGILIPAPNLTCLGLLWRFGAHDTNMSSTLDRSGSDVIANVDVLVAAAGVGVTGDARPDLAVGLPIAIVFVRSAFSIEGQPCRSSAWRNGGQPGH
jgi:Co/Zn/Cd efflux system component